MGVTSYCSSRLLSLSAFKAIALPSYSLAPAKVVVIKNHGRLVAGLFINQVRALAFIVNFEFCHRIQGRYLLHIYSFLI
ncbi:hypothetical protein RHGRI_016603 [Rhododendron griersonianum]|uniref:Uncharacterized protein n=1 Tax=Rhododendron griersonianum TaxID=479676 RepID=A0AAV6JUP9_9ERIC|nr:hypothetical protein RHGRI_016603 [Rhododendron griersonianum]